MTEIWEIEPGVGVGPLTTGLVRSEVRASVSTAVMEYKPDPFGEQTADRFPSLGLFVYYTESDEIDHLEAFTESGLILRYVEIDIVGPVSDISSKFKSKGVAVDKQSPADYGSYEIGDSGIYLYVDDEKRGDIASVTVILSPRASITGTIIESQK